MRKPHWPTLLGDMDGINYTILPMHRFVVGDEVVTDTGLHGIVTDREVIVDETIYTLRVQGNTSASLSVSESRLMKKHSEVKCECGAEAVFGKDTVLHSSTMPCPKYREWK